MSESEHQRFISVGIGHKCRSLRHMHYAKHKVERLVKANEMAWVGKHKQVAMYTNHLNWAKIYNRNWIGEVITCGMQLVRGNRR